MIFVMHVAFSLLFVAVVAVAASTELAGGPLGSSVGFNVMGLGQAVSILSGPMPYTVVVGDTLFDIALRFNVSLACLKSINPQINDPDLIFPGQIITIPSAEAEIPYKVVNGDYFEAIAIRFGVTLEDLEKANPQVTNPYLINPGDILYVPNVCGSNTHSSAVFPCGDAFYHLDMVSYIFQF
jgi:spore coat assembly protein SafA